MRAGYAGGPGGLCKKQSGFSKGSFGIEKIPSKATFGRILSMADGKQIGDVILDVLHERFGTMGEVIALDGKAICSTAKRGFAVKQPIFPGWKSTNGPDCEVYLRLSGSWRTTDITAKKQIITFPAGTLALGH